MHIHICPTEIALFMLVFDFVKIYAFHIKHIVMSAFTKWYDEKCEVCNDDT